MKTPEIHSPETLERLQNWPLEPLVKFPRPRWEDLVRESEKKRKHFDKAKTTRPWGRWRELRGVAAEEVVSVVTGLPRHKSLTDGGEDFFKTDVKGIPPVRPVLAIPLQQPGMRWLAEYYVCVVIEMKEHWGSILGWATQDEVKSARILNMPNAKSYVLYPWELHPGLPPELEMYAALMKKTR